MNGWKVKKKAEKKKGCPSRLLSHSSKSVVVFIFILIKSLSHNAASLNEHHMHWQRENIGIHLHPLSANPKRRKTNLKDKKQEQKRKRKKEKKKKNGMERKRRLGGGADWHQKPLKSEGIKNRRVEKRWYPTRHCFPIRENPPRSSRHQQHIPSSLLTFAAFGNGAFASFKSFWFSSRRLNAR